MGKWLIGSKDAVKEWLKKETDGMMGSHKYTTNDSKDVVKIPLQPTAAVRDDDGKMKWHLLPVPALLALCKVFHGGAIKYNDDNWRKGLKYSRIYRSMISHFMKWLASDSSYDKELGTHHLMMVAWGCFVLYMYEVIYKFVDLDDRTEKDTLTDEDFEFLAQHIENRMKKPTQKTADQWGVADTDSHW